MKMMMRRRRRQVCVTLSHNDVTVILWKTKKCSHFIYAMMLHTLKTKYICLMFTDTFPVYTLQMLSTTYYSSSTFCELTCEPQHLL